MSRKEVTGNIYHNNGTIFRAQSTTQATKLCHIIKRPDFEGYGFNLHSEKVKPGQYIGKVDELSPAEAAGLKEGDKIVEVNGVNIGQETHKQVVQRIKAIASEVHLLLIDVDGGIQKQQPYEQSICTTPADTATMTNSSSNAINNDRSNTNSRSNVLLASGEGTMQEMPGASANISSISMISTKRMSTATSGNDIHARAPVHLGHDLTDEATIIMPMETASNFNGANILYATKEHKRHEPNRNNNMMTASGLVTTPKQVSEIGNSGMTSLNKNEIANNSTSFNKSANSGGLKLPMTAAEMRATLMSKKKYDAKNESFDLKKKFEIIQKL